MRFWYYSFVHIRDLEVPFRQHQSILEMLCRGDAHGAEQIMHEHIDLFLAPIQEALKLSMSRDSQLSGRERESNSEFSVVRAALSHTRS